MIVYACLCEFVRVRICLRVHGACTCMSCQSVHSISGTIYETFECLNFISSKYLRIADS